ncbi:MAG: S-layer homology domain-containing protein [Candidatus Gracilibacteria bacterium]
MRNFLLNKLVLATCAAMILASAPCSVLAANFSDVPANHANVEAIQVLKDAGLVSGYPDGTFKPDNLITRAEASAIILKAAGITAVKSENKLPFTDVAGDAWFYSVLQTGYEMGKLKGYEDKTFKPANPITLPEANVIALSFFKISTKNISVEPVIYSGLDTKEWYAKAMQYAKNQNIIIPDSSGVVDATKTMTRAQVAELIYRLRTATTSGKPFDITKGWIETEYKENFWKLKYPANWEFFKGQTNSVLWMRAKHQPFFTRIWPSSAQISISVEANADSLSAIQYFAETKELYKKEYADKAIPKEFLIGDKSALKVSNRERGTIDLYIYLPNKNVLVFYGEYGAAPIGEFLKKQIEEVYASYQYTEKPPEVPKPVIPLEERMATLRENILIADKWKDLAPLFPDKKLFNTDAIGVGTGPVDYYFTKEANTTIKLERNSGTVLNIRESQTNAF